MEKNPTGWKPSWNTIFISLSAYLSDSVECKKHSNASEKIGGLLYYLTSMWIEAMFHTNVCFVVFFVRNNECNHNCLFTRKLHRVSLRFSSLIMKGKPLY